MDFFSLVILFHLISSTLQPLLQAFARNVTGSIAYVDAGYHVMS
jgi:enoyl-[acyl-carrier-protein] reductase (NADH)